MNCKRNVLSWLLLLSGVSLVLGSCNDISAAKAGSLSLRANRAYSGAPPTINHKVRELGRTECTTCHIDGNAMDCQDKPSPKTPHAELDRCLQCHVEKTTDNLYKQTRFSAKPYAMGVRSQPEGPPHIPHPLTLRENCVGCHATRTTPIQIRTDHPERQRCMQCHIPLHQGFPGPRPNITPSHGLGGQLPEWSL